jgi:Tol biopolymer transport system component
VSSSPLPLPADVEELIVFVSFRDGELAIYGVLPDGTGPFQILSIPRPGQIIPPLDWSESAQRLAFTITTGGRSDIFTINPIRGGLHNVTGELEFSSTEPRWSPDGTRIAFACGDFEPDICVINSDGTNFSQLTTFPFPDWSPDGSAIVFQSSKGGLAGLYIIQLDSLKELTLTDENYQSAGPDWSPRENRIVFHSARTEVMDIYTISSDGSELINLTQSNSTDVDPQWSPDGSMIAFRSDRTGDWNLFVMRKDGSNLINVTEGYGPVYTFSWSPDARFLVFTSNATGNTDIYTVSVDGGDVTNLTRHPSADAFPLWIRIRK